MSNQPHRVIVWAGRSHAGLVRDAAKGAGLEILGAGSDSPESSGALSSELGVPRLDDLRSTIQTSDADAIWIIESLPGEVWNSLPTIDHSLRIFTSEPPTNSRGSALEDRSNHSPTLVPRMVRSPGFRAAREILPQLGEISCVNIAFRSGLDQGSLFARLFDATEVLLSMCDEVQSVNAALAGALSKAPEALPGLHGHLSINFRFKSNCCACASLSDSAGTWFRGVTVLAEGGCVRISDEGFVWHGPDGRELDSHRIKKPCSPGQLVGDQIARTLDELDTAEGPANFAAMLALCEATRLSCLTGQNEAPSRLLEMMSRP